MEVAHRKAWRINWTRRLERTLVELIEQPRADAAQALAELAEAIKTEKSAITENEDLRAPPYEPTSEVGQAIAGLLEPRRPV